MAPIATSGNAATLMAMEMYTRVSPVVARPMTRTTRLSGTIDAPAMIHARPGRFGTGAGSDHHTQSDGAGGHVGSGFQSGAGTQPGGGVGQPGGTRKRRLPDCVIGSGSALLLGGAGQQAPGDHESLDLVGAFADHHERRVTVEALDGEFVRVTQAAVDAHRLCRQLERG